MRLPALKSLQQRLLLLVLVPVAVAILGVGLLGFFYARDIILKEWQEAALLKLQRVAHQLDMRLSRSTEWMRAMDGLGKERGAPPIMSWLMKQLEKQPGVVEVRLVSPDDVPRKEEEQGLSHPMMSRGGRQGVDSSLGRFVEVSPLRYDYEAGCDVFSLVSEMKDQDGRLTGKLETVVRFDFLMEDMTALGWWQSEQACLVDGDGTFLTHTVSMGEDRRRLGETNDPLELAVMKSMKERPSGTVWGPGRPPDRIAGFHRLQNAPWSIVLFARGKDILAPLLDFRDYYAAILAVGILAILLLIRSVVGRSARSIREISEAAEKVAQGTYLNILPRGNEDEIGQLVRSFNVMVDGLVDRDFLSNTFGRYVDQEVARELLSRPEAARLGGEKREVAILLSDLRGFTPLAESLSPEAIIHIVNRYFGLMIEVIQKHHGIIVDFFGDSVLAFFDPLGRPVAIEVQRAVACALEMQGAMGAFNAHSRKERIPELQMGVGVHAGEVIVGNIGSETRAKYGIVGSAVNVTQRIQALAKGGQVLVSEEVLNHVEREVSVDFSMDVELKGLQERAVLFAVRRAHTGGVA
jgi:adenylate cyclase